MRRLKPFRFRLRHFPPIWKCGLWAFSRQRRDFLESLHHGESLWYHIRKRALMRTKGNLECESVSSCFFMYVYIRLKYILKSWLANEFFKLLSWKYIGEYDHWSLRLALRSLKNTSLNPSFVCHWRWTNIRQFKDRVKKRSQTCGRLWKKMRTWNQVQYDEH